MTAAFIGRRDIVPPRVENELRATVEQLISVGYNKFMVASCDTLICYVDTNFYSWQSCSKRVMNYAKRRGVNIINLHR